MELVRVETEDGVRLSGAVQRPAGPARRELDLVLCHHGHAGNFYNPSFFDDVARPLLDLGCAVARVNNRGHDLAYTGPNGRLGAVFETVDDCRLDWRAWLDWAAEAGFGRVLLWGHSLGALKTIYWLANAPGERHVLGAVASSPPRFSFSNFRERGGPEFDAAMRQAQERVAEGEPEALVRTQVPLEDGLFSAHTYVDKYGPADRYDIFRDVPRVRVPLLLTLGELEQSELAFHQLATYGPELVAATEHASFELIAEADHSYTARRDDLWRAVRAWLSRVESAAVVG